MLPIVATLLANGLGLIGNAVLAKGQQVIEEKLGVDIPGALETPEGTQQLLQLQQDHEQFLLTSALENRKVDLETFKAEVGDKDSARRMQEAALGQSDLLAKRFIYYYAAGWSVFAAAYITAATFLTLPETGVRFADLFAGFLLGTLIATFIQFFYGSTVRNTGKDSVISTLTEKMNQRRVGDSK